MLKTLSNYVPREYTGPIQKMKYIRTRVEILGSQSLAFSTGKIFQVFCLTLHMKALLFAEICVIVCSSADRNLQEGSKHQRNFHGNLKFCKNIQHWYTVREIYILYLSYYDDKPQINIILYQHEKLSNYRQYQWFDVVFYGYNIEIKGSIQAKCVGGHVTEKDIWI